MPVETRFDFLYNSKIAHLNRIGKSKWNITGIPDFNKTTFFEIKNEAGFTLKSENGKTQITVDRAGAGVEIVKAGQPMKCPLHNATTRPGAWLLTSLTLVVPVAGKLEFSRVNDEEWHLSEGLEAEISSGAIITGNCLQISASHEALVLREVNGRTFTIGLMGGTVIVRENNKRVPKGGIPVLCGTLLDSSESLTPFTITGFAVEKLSHQKQFFRQISPLEWMATIDGSPDTEIFQATKINPFQLFLKSAKGAELKLLRGHISGKVSDLGGNQKISDTSDELQLWQRAPKITSRSNLAEDHLHQSASGATPKNPLRDEGVLVYRTTVHLPLTVRSVEVWTGEEAEIDVDGQHVKTDNDRSVRVIPRRPGRLNISMPAKGLHAPAIYLRTNTMRPNDRAHIIHPDVEVHKKIATMDGHKLRQMKTDGHLPADMSNASVDALHTALQSLTRAVQYTHNKTPTGIHHDRFVHPSNMLAPHMELNFDAGRVPEMRLHHGATPTVEAQLVKLRSHPNFVRHDVHAGQSLWDVWEDVKGAAKVVIHTVEAVGEDLVNTAEHVVKDTGEMIHDIGEHAMRGDVLGMVDDVIQGGEHIAGDLGKGVADVVSDGVKGAGQLLVVTAGFIKDAVGTAYEFVIHNTGMLGEGLNWLITKAGGILGKFLRGFLDMFGWENVLQTQKALSARVSTCLDALIVSADKLRSSSDAFFSKIIKDNDHLFDKAIEAVLGHERPESVAQYHEQSAAMDALEWILGKLSLHGSAAPPIPSVAMPGHAAGPMDEISAFIAENFGSESEVRTKLLDGAFSEMSSAITDFRHAPEHLFAALVELIRAGIDLGLEILSKLIGMVIDLMKHVFMAFKRLITTPISIPILDDFYDALTGQPLTILNLTMLIVALPVTIISELILGRAPFQSSRAGQEATPQQQEDWALAYGGLHLVLGVVSPAENAIQVGQNVLSGKGTGKFNLMAPKNGPSASFGVGNGVLRTLSVVVGFFAQYSGNPITPGGDYGFPELKSKFSPIEAPGYWSHVVWWYQWPGVAISLLSSGVVSGIELKKGNLTAVDTTGDIMAGVTTVYGFFHVVLMGVLHQSDLDKHQFIHDIQHAENGHYRANFNAAFVHEVNDICEQDPTITPQTMARYRSLIGPRSNAVGMVDAGVTREAGWHHSRNAGIDPQSLRRHAEFVHWRTPNEADKVTYREWLEEIINFRDFATPRDAGTGLQNKLTANVMDCVPEVSAFLAAPTTVEATEGISVLAAIFFDAMGHFTEGGIHIDRCAKGQLL